VAAARSVADDQRDELVVAERGGAVAAQLLARPIVGRQVLHLTLSGPVYWADAGRAPLVAVRRGRGGDRERGVRRPARQGNAAGARRDRRRARRRRRPVP